MRNVLGFTLIELLITIALIGIISAIVLTTINPAQKLAQARNSQRKADLGQFKFALEAYFVAHGNYPPTAGAWCGPNGSAWYNCGDDWVPGLVATGEMPRLLQDLHVLQPNSNNSNATCATGANNAYIYFSDGSNYKLVANCTPEGSISAIDPFNDPNRSGWSYAIWSSGAAAW